MAKLNKSIRTTVVLDPVQAVKLVHDARTAGISQGACLRRALESRWAGSADVEPLEARLEAERVEIEGEIAMYQKLKGKRNGTS